MKIGRGWNRTFAGAVALTALAFASGCEREGTEQADGELLPPPAERASDGVFSSGAIQSVVDAQVARAGDRLLTFMEDGREPVRRRAAFAAASVQDEATRARLLQLLEGDDSELRADAAFALGQMDLPEGGTALLAALETEEDREVRTLLLGALGKRADAAALTTLAGREAPDGQEAAVAMALSRGLARDVVSEPILDRLVASLEHADPAVREAAAYGFGRSTELPLWEARLPALRAALSRASAEGGAASVGLAELHLIRALGRAGDTADLPAFLDRLSGASDWRLRVTAAQALAAESFLSEESAVDALVSALDDPSEHVAVAAATVLARSGDHRAPVLGRIAPRVVPGSERWRWMIPLLQPLIEEGEGARVLEWTRGMVGVDPTAVMHGARTLGVGGFLEAEDFLFELTESPEVIVQAGAVDGLGALWLLREGDEAAMTRYGVRFADMAHQAPTAAAIRAARYFALPSFEPLRNAMILEEALAVRLPFGDPYLTRGLAEAVVETGDLRREPQFRAMTGHADYRVRVIGAEALLELTGEVVDPDVIRALDPEREVDWRYLAEVGRHPRLRIETTRGEMVVVLDTEQAPLTVQSITEQVAAGFHDGVRFHRVVPNFVIQAGDVSVGDGTGGPGYRMRSEFTRIPFERGVIGMASSGKDTEGSQWFITHSPQPHLDGQYTAFGWLESGSDVLDRIMEGDRVIRITLERDTEGTESY